ncbi:hypothetical protein C8R45DRAFT_885247 [Mycena sanguinolenta]|nr:hypothetical protein C8R45DRAFT_885247 [Mycena sanguinolenta]
MSQPPAKRRRDERDENLPIMLTRSEVWISDGNVVLQAENTQFRVHLGVLARHSAVFRDMQGLAQTTDERSVEGCPIIQLSDDPTDVEYLLNALYNPTFLLHKKLSLKCIAALIRLGRKYDLKDLLDFAVDRLTTEFPSTLGLFELAQPGVFRFRTIESYPGIDLDVITLLSENNILCALPSAYYRAAEMYTLGHLIDAVDKCDGARGSLSHTDLRRCAVGQQRLLLKQFEPGYTFGWARKWDFNDCSSPDMCRTSRENILAAYMAKNQIFAFVGVHSFNGFKFCDACTRHATDSAAAGKKKFWQELPQIFDLPPWNELVNDL